MINKDIFIEDLVQDYPEIIGPLSEMGIICIACGEPVWGTLEELVIKKGLNNIDEIMIKLNKIIKNKNDHKN